MEKWSSDEPVSYTHLDVYKRQVSMPKARGKKRQEEAEVQLALIPPNETEVMGRLRQLDVNTLTPIECMNTLFELCRLAK